MTEIITNRLDTAEPDFSDRLKKLLEWDEIQDIEVQRQVLDIIARIRREKDNALLEYTRRFDDFEAASAAHLEISREILENAWQGLPDPWSQALEAAANRIRDYARHQKMESWDYQDQAGVRLGQRVTPIKRVGLYVPGGKAAYPSSVLMNAIPAKVANVDELIMVVPTPHGERNDMVLAAAWLAEVDRVFAIGGAQAIASLAYGTETIPRVDKIVGPGNIYVATAKKLVFGQVGIDMIAGPSEIVIICDGNTDPDWIAADLFSQAEHDEDAQAILLSPDSAFLERVEQGIHRLLPEMERADIIRTSMANRGALIKVADLDDAVSVVNEIAPEHLELSVENPESLLDRIDNAGAIFMGRYTAEALGDYCAGPNHVLPTSRTARYSSPLGVYDFQKRSSMIQCSADSASELGKIASILARCESLTAHARSAEFRVR